MRNITRNNRANRDPGRGKRVTDTSAVLRRLPDLAFGAIVAAGAVVLLIEAADLPRRSGLFPRAVLWCVLVVGLGLLLTSALDILRGAPGDSASGRGWRDGILVPAAILIGAGAILYAFGFYVVSPILILTVYLWHTHATVGDALSARNLRTGVTLAFVATGVMYLIFNIVIGLPAPSGALI